MLSLEFPSSWPCVAAAGCGRCSIGWNPQPCRILSPTSPAPPMPNSLPVRLPADALFWKSRRCPASAPMAGSLLLCVGDGSSSAASAAKGEGSSGCGGDARAPLVGGAAVLDGGRLTEDLSCTGGRRQETWDARKPSDLLTWQNPTQHCQLGHSVQRALQTSFSCPTARDAMQGQQLLTSATMIGSALARRRRRRRRRRRHTSSSTSAAAAAAMPPTTPPTIAPVLLPPPAAAAAPVLLPLPFGVVPAAASCGSPAGQGAILASPRHSGPPLASHSLQQRTQQDEWYARRQQAGAALPHAATWCNLALPAHWAPSAPEGEVHLCRHAQQRVAWLHEHPLQVGGG